MKGVFIIFHQKAPLPPPFSHTYHPCSSTEGKDVKSNITQSGVVRMSAPQCVRLPTKEAALVRCCFLSPCSPTTAPTPTTPPHNRATQRIEDKMEVVIKDCADNSYVIEVSVDDTSGTMRQKVASAVGLAEDSFHMGFGGKDEGDDITQLSAGDTIILTKTKKFEARAVLHALGEDITAERLETVEDPEVACLLLQAEVATVIPDMFLAQTSLTALDLSAVSCVTEIGDEFLYQCTSLTSIDLSGLTRLTRIGTSFLADCSSLTAVDLSPLRNVRQIDRSFLYECTSLTSVDLPPLRNVTHISTRFLSRCSSLVVVDLSPLCNVTYIHGWFLYNCSSLTAVDLSPLRNVTHIDRGFLTHCSSLTVVDLSPLRNVTHIDDCFLALCPSLKVVDLSALSNVTQIDGRFLAHCSSLTAVDLSPLSNVTRIGPKFLADCSSLTELDLSPLSGVMHFGDLPDYSYTSLRSIHLGGCSSAVSSRVRECKLKEYVVDAPAPPPPPPTRGRDKTKADVHCCSVS